MSSLINCEAASLTVFTTMCPKEQQTNDNLIVKDQCFIIEIFDKYRPSGILTGWLSHLKGLCREQGFIAAINCLH